MKKQIRSLFLFAVFCTALLNTSFTAEALEGITSSEVLIDESAVMDEDTVIYSQFLPELSYAFDENTFLYYNQLDSNNSAVYEAMKIWCEPDESSFTVSLPNPISYETTSKDMTSWDTEQTNEFWNLIFSNILYAEKAMIFDYPDLFWLDTSKIRVSLGSVKTSKKFGSSTYTMKISSFTLKGNVKDVYKDVETATEYKQILNDSVADFEIDGTDRYQQVKYIHDYISNTVSYNESAPYYDTALGLFIEPFQIVCEGYSKAFKMLCNKLDIPCIVVPGNLNEETHVGHMWNYVMMEDGKWYGIDCTWDDTDIASSPVKYSYFLKGSDNFNKNHTPESEFTYPLLNTDDYVYDTSVPSTTAPPATTTSTSTTTTTITTKVTTTTDIPEHIMGDYNLDGKIDTADIVILRKYIVKKISESELPSADDLNNDNVINIFDCLILTRIVLKM